MNGCHPKQNDLGNGGPLLGATSPLLGATSPLLGATSPLLGATSPLLGATGPPPRGRGRGGEGRGWEVRIPDFACLRNGLPGPTEKYGWARDFAKTRKLVICTSKSEIW